jgi:hypothetical protein
MNRKLRHKNTTSEATPDQLTSKAPAVASVHGAAICQAALNCSNAVRWPDGVAAPDEKRPPSVGPNRQTRHHTTQSDTCICCCDNLLKRRTAAAHINGMRAVSHLQCHCPGKQHIHRTVQHCTAVLLPAAPSSNSTQPLHTTDHPPARKQSGVPTRSSIRQAADQALLLPGAPRSSGTQPFLRDRSSTRQAAS